MSEQPTRHGAIESTHKRILAFGVLSFSSLIYMSYVFNEAIAKSGNINLWLGVVAGSCIFIFPLSFGKLLGILMRLPYFKKEPSQAFDTGLLHSVAIMVTLLPFMVFMSINGNEAIKNGSFTTFLPFFIATIAMQVYAHFAIGRKHALILDDMFMEEFEEDMLRRLYHPFKDGFVDDIISDAQISNIVTRFRKHGPKLKSGNDLTEFLAAIHGFYDPFFQGSRSITVFTKQQKPA